MTSPHYRPVRLACRSGRALPDAELDAFVEALATRISGFDKWAIANTKRLVNTSLPPDDELGAGWDACTASIGRPAAQAGVQALMAQGFHQPGEVENRLGYYLGQIKRCPTIGRSGRRACWRWRRCVTGGGGGV
jgi:hypothetical protein